MFKKWYIIICVIAVAIFGFTTQQQTVIPNQEIVLQFLNDQVTAEETQSTIALVKEQLYDLGVSHIKVKETKKGTLKITYYSNDDVTVFKEHFSNKLLASVNVKNKAENSNEFPVKDSPLEYQLKVYEIQNSQNGDWDLNGVIVVSFETKSNHFFEPNSYSFLDYIQYLHKDFLLKETGKIYNYSVSKKINSSRIIPEVRAGPIC